MKRSVIDNLVAAVHWIRARHPYGLNANGVPRAAAKHCVMRA